MTEFPSNDLERGLAEAAEGRLEVAKWLRDLARASVWVPMQSTDGASGSFPVLSIEGGSFVPVFTSEGQIDKAAPQGPRVNPPVRELVASLPDSVGLAVNPGGAVGLPIAAGALRDALDLPHHVPAGARVRIGEPAEEPAALLGALAAQAKHVPAVRELRRAWAAVGEADPGLVVGVDLDPDNQQTREAAMAEVRSAVAAQSTSFTVDVVFASDRDSMMEWMTQHAEPFYRA